VSKGRNFFLTETGFILMFQSVALYVSRCEKLSMQNPVSLPDGLALCSNCNYVESRTIHVKQKHIHKPSQHFAGLLLLRCTEGKRFKGYLSSWMQMPL